MLHLAALMWITASQYGGGNTGGGNADPEPPAADPPPPAADPPPPPTTQPSPQPTNSATTPPGPGKKLQAAEDCPFPCGVAETSSSNATLAVVLSLIAASVLLCTFFVFAYMKNKRKGSEKGSEKTDGKKADATQMSITSSGRTKNSDVGTSPNVSITKSGKTVNRTTTTTAQSVNRSSATTTAQSVNRSSATTTTARTAKRSTKLRG